LECKVQEYFDTEFWDLVYKTYGVQDELDILSESVTQIIQPIEGMIILITKDFNNGKKS